MCVCMCSVAKSCPIRQSDCVNQIAACQAPLSMGFPRQKQWSGLPWPLQRDLPDPGTEPRSSVSNVLKVDSLPTKPLGKSQCIPLQIIFHHRLL